MITTRKDGKETADQYEIFLGYLATVVKSWKLILIVPALIAALSYVYLSARPNLYRSDAVLRLTKDDVVVLKSGRVFGEAVKKIGAANSPGVPAPAAMVVTSASASVALTTLDSRDDYNVSVTYNSAAGAAAILQEAIDRLPAQTLPSAFDRARLEDRIKALSEAQDNIAKSLAKMNDIYDRAITGEPTTDSIGLGADYGLSVAQLMATFAKNNEDLGTARSELQSTFGPADVIQAPTVPTLAVARSISPFVTLMFVLSFGVLLVFVLVRAALNDAKSSPNLTRVRRALLPWARS